MEFLLQLKKAGRGRKVIFAGRNKDREMPQFLPSGKYSTKWFGGKLFSK